ncbi:hypothetical protein ABFS82_13G012400 [Erythranthe guttata]|uniref:Glycosyltransferase n=1 Tax=Erythranthe guttata TaxID=4155 RepID=A0A022RS31_ERYGU|nr:PREDICTED: anthocyanidin 3-O-glucosyltransferase 2-like [Erythranthe guttata]EYU42869.1 hypothetical protein MIMGU_mgv1a005089mg [Erythranthe guttata]|eukprot:XP_012830921.1 PREDICTED: anthocyanidin 3-O-glucosyltransferase 2-like [Erythranthe guttata]
MEKTELVFIPSPGLSHLISTVETAKLLLDRDNRHRLSITVLITKLPNDTTVASYIEKFSSAASSSSHLRFVNLPGDEEEAAKTGGTPSKTFTFDLIDRQSTNIREIVSDLVKQPRTSRMGALVLDMFCTKFVEIADEFGIPAYVFFTSGACSLGVLSHLVSLKLDRGEDLTRYKGSDTAMAVPSFSLPVPAKILPAVMVEGGPMADVFMNYFSRLKDMKGIMVNTFYELESYAVDSLRSGGKSQTPKIYPIGPILNSGGGGGDDDKRIKSEEIKKWLDEQPENSVVFLCFGTMGSFEESQVREIAAALEKSGKRFLWSLRKPGVKGSKIMFPTEYESFEEVLPEGFLERTEGIGRVTGWAPQVAVLSHPAVGGFVSHCGWNSTLESVWYGVPVATFPMYAEQQLNAFQLVKELGMAEEIRINYKIDFRGDSPPEIVGAADIEAAIRRLMAAEEEEGGGGVRRKVKEMQSKSRAALLEGGSSYEALSLFIEDIIKDAV